MVSEGRFFPSLTQTSAEVMHAGRDHQHLDDHEALGAESVSLLFSFLYLCLLWKTG